MIETMATYAVPKRARVRCRVCTLHSPCPHTNRADASVQEMERRGLYPRGKKGATVCPAYAATGLCRAFEVSGRCSYNHPAVCIPAPPSLCRTCTLPTPCHVHFPTLGTPLCADDAAIAAMGLEQRFAPMEIIGTAGRGNAVLYSYVVSSHEGVLTVVSGGRGGLSTVLTSEWEASVTEGSQMSLAVSSVRSEFRTWTVAHDAAFKLRGIQYRGPMMPPEEAEI